MLADLLAQRTRQGDCTLCISLAAAKARCQIACTPDSSNEASKADITVSAGCSGLPLQGSLKFFRGIFLEHPARYGTRSSRSQLCETLADVALLTGERFVPCARRKPYGSATSARRFALTDKAYPLSPPQGGCRRLFHAHVLMLNDESAPEYRNCADCLDPLKGYRPLRL